MAGAMRRKEAPRRAAQPPRAIERTDPLAHTSNDTREARTGERSLAAPRRTSPSDAQAEAERAALGVPLGVKASAVGAAPRRERRRQPSAGLAVAATSAR